MGRPAVNATGVRTLPPSDVPVSPANGPARHAGYLSVPETLASSLQSEAHSAQSFVAAQITATQPARKHNPPIGVIAPSTFTPVNASAYRLPLNKTIPATNK